MQLVYFWTEKSLINLETLNNLEINFSSNFQFKLKKNNKIYILERNQKEEKTIPNNFFGKGISNISCIIGNNGSGKTTLIKDILIYQYYTTFNSTYNITLPRHLFIFEENNKFFIYNNFKNLRIILDDEDYFFNEDCKLKKANLIKYVFFSTSFNTNFLPKFFSNVSDISFRNQIENLTIKKEEIAELKSDIIKGKLLLRKYDEELFRKILNLIINNKIVIDNIPYKEFKEKLLRIKKDSKIICTFKFNNILDERANKIFKKINTNNLIKNNPLDNILIKIWEYITLKIIDDISEKNINENIINEISFREKKEDIKIWLERNLEIILKRILNYREEFFKENDIGGFYPNLNLEEKDVSYIKDIINFLSLNKEITIYDNQIIFSFLKNKELFNCLFEWINGYDLYTLELEEKFSSGEIAFLNLIINLKNIPFFVKNYSSIILFFEELEAFMHPEWQRRIIDFLPQLKKCIPYLENKNIQIILTSHTPFIVGDLPEKNIIFLNQNNQSNQLTKTFGSNIYNLFKDNFLLESCFGEFSKKKIKKVIDLLSKDKEDNYNIEEIEKNIAEIEFIIDSIGEPLIKNRLEKMYNEYKEFKNEKTIKTADFYTYLKENNLNLNEVLKILEERKK